MYLQKIFNKSVCYNRNNYIEKDYQQVSLSLLKLKIKFSKNLFFSTKHFM